MHETREDSLSYFSLCLTLLCSAGSYKVCLDSAQHQVGKPICLAFWKESINAVYVTGADTGM